MPFTDHIIQAIKGRKYTAYLVTSVLVFVSGVVIHTDKLPTIVTGLLGCLTLLTAGHTATDIAAQKKTEAK